MFKIEQTFRIAKSDLETRPIYHFIEDSIKLQLLICFLALVISKHIELKTGISIRRFITVAKKTTDTKMFYKLTQKQIIVKRRITKSLDELFAKLKLFH